jgi:hypothetical protein
MIRNNGEDMRRENSIALGLVLIILGCLVLVFANSPVSATDFTLRGSVDNSVLNIPRLNVSGFFSAGEHFIFNFTKGRFWGVAYEADHQGFSPFDPNFAPNSSILAYKEVYFDIFTPSGDFFTVDVYVIEGINPFVVVYDNQSADFVPLNGGNFTGYAVVEGIVHNTGNYTVKATIVFPLVQRDENHTYTVETDPPQLMNLWEAVNFETKPYLAAFASLGTILITSGAVSAIVWGRKPGNRRRRHLTRTEAKTGTSKG